MYEGFQDPAIQANIENAPETAAAHHPREVLDTVKRGTIVALARLGASRRMAAREVGCSPSTITRTAGRDPQFAERLAEAESQADRKALHVIDRAVEQEKYWRAAAWILERRNPEEFGRRAPHTFTSEQVMEITARLIRVVLPAVPGERRDEVLLEFSDTLNDLSPLIAQSPSGDSSAPGVPKGTSADPYVADEENMSFARLEEIRRAHWERTERWIGELSDDKVFEVKTAALHRVHEHGNSSWNDPWANRLWDEWHKRCRARPVTYPGGIVLPSSVPFAEAVKIVEAIQQKTAKQQPVAQQPTVQQATELGG